MAREPQLGFTFNPETAANEAPVVIQRRIWNVSQLVEAARQTLEREIGSVWVEGEVSNFHAAPSGHLYFTMKDADSQLKSAMFRPQARLLKFRPENGMHIIARGRLTIYETRGDLQLMVETLEPVGAGALQIAFEQLKAKLAAEGLFDAARKRPLPALPKRIGIVTSPRGAAIRDMLNILHRRHEGVNVLLYPAQVQGTTAAQEVREGIEWFNRECSGDGVSEEKRVDVIIIGRGGGSAEDLAAFNDEALARAIAASQIPIISAVGHEVDFTIADFVADLRAATPSAAAELVVEAKHTLLERVMNFHQRAGRAIRYSLMMARKDFTALEVHPSFSRFADLLHIRHQRIDELSYRLVHSHSTLLQERTRKADRLHTRLMAHSPVQRLSVMHRQSEALHSRLLAAGKIAITQQRAQYDHITTQLNGLSPLAILERGYAVVFDASGNIVKDAAKLKTGEEISARVHKGMIQATVNKLRTDD